MRCTQYHDPDYLFLGILTILMFAMAICYRHRREAFEYYAAAILVAVSLWWLGVAVNNWFIK